MKPLCVCVHFFCNILSLFKSNIFSLFKIVEGVDKIGRPGNRYVSGDKGHTQITVHLSAFLVCAAMTNTSLQHFSTTPFPKTLLHNTSPQHLSTTLFSNTPLQHSSPTLLYNNLLQHPSQTRSKATGNKFPSKYFRMPIQKRQLT